MHLIIWLKKISKKKLGENILDFHIGIQDKYWLMQ